MKEAIHEPTFLYMVAMETAVTNGVEKSECLDRMFDTSVNIILHRDGSGDNFSIGFEIESARPPVRLCCKFSTRE